MEQNDDPEYLKLISFNSLTRARTTIEDFVLSYFPLHGLNPLTDFLKFWDVLVFVEATIYEMDEENENLASKGQISPKSASFPGERALADALRKRGLMNSSIQMELANGKNYWRQEQELCHEMLSQTLASSPEKIHKQLERVHAASRSKSFDYRVLNYVLYALQGKEPDKQLIIFLHLDEHLVDIGDDLHDYEDDVLKNSFNIYRAYVHLFGPNAQLKLVERIVEFERQHQTALQALPQWMQDAYLIRRKQAGAEPGSLRWQFPNPIHDEAKYRASVLSDTGTNFPAK